MAKLVKCNEPKPPRLVAGWISVSGGTPTIEAGNGFTITDVAAGQVKITFNQPGRQILSALATAKEGTDATAYSVKEDARVEASSVTFGIYVHDATDGALADNVAFNFMVLLSDSDI